MDDKLTKIKCHLSKCNHKLTRQREAILAALLKHNKEHLSAEKVYLLVKNNKQEIGLATVYRTLELFCKLMVLYKVNFDDGVTRYELRDDTAEHHHHHLYCLLCGGINEIMEDWLESIERKIVEDFAFKILDHRLTFQGICQECQQKSSV